MTGEKKKLLFVTQSLDNTGSEVLLFHFINHLADRYAVTVICFKKGSLVGQLNKLVNLHVIEIGEAKSILAKINRRFKLLINVTLIFRKYKDHLWYINTIILPVPVKFAVKNKIEFILHSHELKHMYALLSTDQLQLALHQPKLIVANSQITKNHLIEAGSNRPIQIIHPFIDVRLISSLIKSRNKVNTTFTWCMAGTIDKNKNPDLFVEIAIEAKRQDLPYEFRWLYNSVSEEELFSRIQEKMRSNNLSVQFIQTKNYEDYLHYLAQADGLLLTSTFESFSLVTLESLALNKAIVVTDCGGVSEIINNELASVVPLNSQLQTYLTKMKFEENRSIEFQIQKIERAHQFDKKTLLSEWENLLLNLGKIN